jgi:molecular chaperone IbpA
MALPFPPWRLLGGPSLPAFGSYAHYRSWLQRRVAQEVAGTLEIATGISNLILAARTARRWVPCGGPELRAPDAVSDALVSMLLKEDMAMRTFDPTPLWRSTVGFDRLFDLIDESMRWTGEDNYPPYNIERTGEDNYQIALALAGFTPEELTITAEQNVLTVEGSKADKDEHQYLYQGISARPFRRVFNLADYVQVKGASFEGGLLKIDLVREVPEAMKPRRIAINAGTQQIDHKQAA